MDIDAKILHWLAGLLEAEGSFIAPPPTSPNTPLISISMTDEDIVTRVAHVWGVKYHYWKSKNPKHKPTYITHLKGYRASDLMHLLYPLMSKRRQAQINKALENYVYKPDRRGENNSYSKLTDIQVSEIKQRLVNGQTQKNIAKVYNISERAVSDINCGKTWSHVK